jgi:hypothetical protein
MPASFGEMGFLIGEWGEKAKTNVRGDGPELGYEVVIIT